MLCTQCGWPAARCARCAGALCPRRLCAELHEASCAGVSGLPSSHRPAGPTSATSGTSAASRTSPASAGSPRRPGRSSGKEARTTRDSSAERLAVEQLVAVITRHRRAGQAALLAGDLDTAFHELWLARELEPDLDRFGAAAREALPADWEPETDLIPLARALAARAHPRAGEAWRRVLDEAPPRSVQGEAAEWLAREAWGAGQTRAGLRAVHAASLLGRPADPQTVRAAYKAAGLDPAGVFALYLSAIRLDAGSARAAGLRDPLTDQTWPDQDGRWWLSPAQTPSHSGVAHETDHQHEALQRARDLALGSRDMGWLLLAEGDYLAGPLGVRVLGRTIRSGSAESADHDAFVRIRIAYEEAADRLPEVAWPHYRLAELLAWGGFPERAREQLPLAERRDLGGREADRSQRPQLRALVNAGLGLASDTAGPVTRPYPARPFAPTLLGRLRRLAGRG
jgi:hypothetical protein